MTKICVIGAGIIGSAIAKSLLKSEFEKVIATGREIDKLKELEKLGTVTTMDNKKAAEEANVILLSVKPTDIKNVLLEIREKIKDKLVISVAAAVPLQFLKKIAPEARFVRAMPNIAVLVQEAFTAYCVESEITIEDKNMVKRVFRKMGKYIEVKEQYMDALTGLSGGGPAYLSIIIESFMYAGLKVGLPRKLALLASAQTAIGTGKLVLEIKKNLSELKDMVVTPAGVTIEGIYELEDSGIRTAIMRAVEQATKKSWAITKAIENAT